MCYGPSPYICRQCVLHHIQIVCCVFGVFVWRVDIEDMKSLRYQTLPFYIESSSLASCSSAEKKNIVLEGRFASSLMTQGCHVFFVLHDRQASEDERYTTLFQPPIVHFKNFLTQHRSPGKRELRRISFPTGKKSCPRILVFITGQLVELGRLVYPIPSLA